MPTPGVAYVGREQQQPSILQTPLPTLSYYTICTTYVDLAERIPTVSGRHFRIEDILSEVINPELAERQYGLEPMIWILIGPLCLNAALHESLVVASLSRIELTCQ